MAENAKRPQCTRIAASYYIETQYGSAFNDSGIDKLFPPNEPILFEVTQGREDDTETIKGYEFPYDPDEDVIISQDAAVPFNFRGYLNVLGWLFSLIAGSDSVVDSSPNYTHTFKIQDACVNDQPPSTNLVTGYLSDTASYYKWTGVCVNELKVTVDKPGVASVTGSFQTDGQVTVDNTFAWPSSISAADVISGVDADFLMDDYGGSPSSYKTKFMGAEFTLNQNLDIADGRKNFANSSLYLDSLRFGDRAIALMVKMQGHQGDEFWVDYLAKTAKDIELLLTLSATRTFSFRCKKVTIASIRPGFDGIRDMNEITFKAYYEDADSSPWVVTIQNGDAAYLLPIGVGM